MLNQLILIPLLFAQAPTYQFGTDENFQSGQFNVSFSTFDAIEEPGQIAIGPDRVISWEAGTRPEVLITLGDIQQTGAQDFSLGQIFTQGGTNIEDYVLADFPLLANSTLENAAEATGNDPEFLDNVLLDGDTIGEAIEKGDGGKTLAEKIGIDTPLKEIEKVQDTVIGKLEKWESEAIGKIPGLSAVPFARYPAQLANQSLASISLFAEADLILDAAEKGIDNTISGSDKEKTKFQTPCPFAQQQACGHIEFGRAFPVAKAMRGKRWINGKHQKVRGGSGALGAIFGNKEPTGRLPFGPGSPFKLVLTETNEQEDKASFSAYFQFCKFLAGCTGYNIGPFPLYSVTIRPGKGGTVWLGVNPEDFGKIPIGFDPAVVSSPDGATSANPAALYSQVGSAATGGFGDEGRCADANRSRPTYLWPARGIKTSPFGPRPSPGGIGSTYHEGVDVAAPTGTPIVAGEGGIVEFSDYRGGLGYSVFMRVECTGHQLRYGHNSRLLVKPGQKVKKGQIIALMGSTGNSTGPHSHFEVRVGGYAVDPEIYLSGNP